MSGTAIASRGISERLALTQRGEVHYLDFPARLAALVPPPRVHLTALPRGVRPHAALRGAITPAGRGLGAKAKNAATQRSPCKTRLDDLGATTQARVRDRYRTLPPQSQETNAWRFERPFGAPVCAPFPSREGASRRAHRRT